VFCALFSFFLKKTEKRKQMFDFLKKIWYNPVEKHLKTLPSKEFLQ